jgi:hypothetical protein
MDTFQVKSNPTLQIKVYKNNCEFDNQDIEYLNRQGLPTPHFFLLIIGEPRSGKTNLIKDLLFNKIQRKFYKVFNNISIFTNSEDDFQSIGYDYARQYDPLVLEQMYNELRTDEHFEIPIDMDLVRNEQKLASYYQRLKDKGWKVGIISYNEIKPQDEYQQIDNYDSQCISNLNVEANLMISKPILNLFVFDDLTERINSNKKQFAEMIQNRRHHHLSIIMITHWYNRVEKRIRSGADYVIMFKPTNLAERKELYNQRPMVKTFEEFDKICDFVFDQPHNFLYIDYRSNKIHKNFEQIVL